MSLEIGDLLGEGFERTTARNGLLLVAAFYVVGLPRALLSADINRQIGGQPGSGPPPLELALPVAGVLAVVAWLASTVVVVGAVRTFVGEGTGTIDESAFTRNLGWVLLNLLLGGIAYGLLVSVGLVLFVVPGVFLAVSLFFYNYVVIVEGEDFVTAFERSWELTAGRRIQLAVLGLSVGFVTLVLSLLFGLPEATLPDVAAIAVRQIGVAAGDVFLYATASRTYVRLTREHADEPPRPEATADRRGAGHAVE